MLYRSPWLGCAFALMCASAVLADDEPVMVLAGDGLTVVVLEYDEESGRISGQLRHKGKTYPFKGRAQETEDADVVTGEYVAGGETFRFTARSVSDESGDMLFTTGKTTFHLKPVLEIPADAAPERRSPLEEDDARDESAPRPQPAIGTTSRPAETSTAARPAVPGGPVRLKRHVFHDVTMGMPSHVVLLPEDWAVEGRVEWSTGDVPYPQQMFRITSPEKARFATAAAHTSVYTVMNNVPGFEPIPPQGMPPPRNIPEWIVALLQKTGHVQDIRLVRAQRDRDAEAAITKLQAEIGANDAGMQRESWVVLFDYAEDGVRRREEVRLLYVRYAPIINQNLTSQMWSVFPSSIVSAPVEKFEKVLPQMHTVGATIRPTPQWWIASQTLLAELSRARIAASAELIRRRAREFDRLSDAQMAKFRQDMQSMDRRQKDTIDTIYERQDYRDTDGSLVNLSIHHKYVFADGSGNYLMTNSMNDRPGAGWQLIEPAK